MKNLPSKLIGGFAFISAVLLLKPKKANNSIIIGDSQTFLISNNTSKVTLRNELCQSGWNVENLRNALSKQPIDKTVSSVFISIGTNGNFAPSDRIELLMDLVKTIFPKANTFVIQGSWGWGNNTSWNTQKINAYYLRFHNKGAYVLHQPIGYTTNHPTASTPTIKVIANEINTLI